jgi:hypothetical protein
VAGVTINFTANKDAVPNPPSAVTDAKGMARTFLQLPNVPSTITVTAAPASVVLTPKRASFVEYSVSTTNPKIVVVSGNDQVGQAGTPLPQPLVVRVTDQFGQPVSGNTVAFSDNGTGGSFPNGNTVVTGADGTASCTYILPNFPDTVTINAAATGISSPAVFKETSVAGSSRESEP